MFNSVCSGWLRAHRSPANPVKKSLIKLAFLLSVPISVWAQQYTISTFAGTGQPGASGDHGTAVDAELSAPVGVVIGTAGTIFIVDNGNELIRVVSGGIITTYAGDGAAGYFGDGEAAIHAQLNSPAGAALDSSGNLYIADSGNNVIRMVTPDGTINTIAGSVCSLSATSGCGPGYSGDGGAPTAALLNSPLAVAVDPSGNLYIADAGNNVIRKISGGIISTIHSTLPLGHPSGIALDGARNLFIADTSNNRVVKLTPSGAATIVAGNGVPGYTGDNGPAIQAELEFPAAVAVDGVGNLYIADKTNCVIREVNTAGTIFTIAGNGLAGYSGEGVAVDQELNFPSGVTVDAFGNLYIADTGNNRIRFLQAPPPAISQNGVVNAASFASPLSPGELATVFGTSFGVSIAGATSLPLPTSLASVSVTVGGRLAPIFYVGPAQLNFQVPWETGTGNVNVSVSVNGVAGNTISVPVVASSTGLFTEGAGAAVQNPDYSLNTTSNPAAAGSTLTAYLTGSGPVTQTPADGIASPATPLIKATLPVTATIGTQSAPVVFAGLAPGLVGVFQVDVTVPSGTAAGTYPLTITVGTQASNSASISVK